MTNNKKPSQVKLTTRGRHAVMAMVELSLSGKETPVPLAKLAEPSKISLSYLEQLFAALRRHGLVKSYRGPGGGYVLARPAKEILISDILVSAEDCLPARRSGSNDDKPEEYGNAQTRALWSHIGDILHTCLRHVSLEDVANQNLSNHPVTNKLIESFR